MLRESLTGTGTMVRLILRRDRWRLPVWLLAIVGLVYASASAAQGLYSTPEELRTYARTVESSPAAIIMSGPPVALETTGGVAVFEVNFVAVIAVALMAIFMTVRHTRAEEEAGRTELLRAAVLGHLAPSAATAAVVSAASLLAGSGITVSLLALDLEVAGSLVYGASLASLGVVFTFVALVAAQLTEHSRAALSASAAVLAGSYVLRGAGDVGDGTLSWLSPIGWVQASHAFDDDRWWPLTLALAASAVLGWVSVVLVHHRDLGAGMLASRPGPARASRGLRGMVGFAARMQRGSALGWGIGVFLLGVAFGSLGQEVTEMAEESPELAEILASGDSRDLVDSFFATVLRLQALLACGFLVSSVLRLRGEEGSGRAELLLTTGQSRSRWVWSWLLVAGVATAAVVAAGGVGAGLAHGVATGDPDQVMRLLGACLAYLPATLLLGGLTALLFGMVPRLAFLAWVVLAGCFVVGWLGDLLELPDWLIDLSPFAHIPRLPAAEPGWTPIVAVSVLALALGSLAFPGLRRRDLG